MSDLPHSWRSVDYAARHFNRSPITIRHLCANGTFSAFDVPVYKDRKGRWWLCIVADSTLNSPTD